MTNSGKKLIRDAQVKRESHWRLALLSWNSEGEEEAWVKSVSSPRLESEFVSKQNQSKKEQQLNNNNNNEEKL